MVAEENPIKRQLGNPFERSHDPDPGMVEGMETGMELRIPTGAESAGPGRNLGWRIRERRTRLKSLRDKLSHDCCP